MKRSGVQAVSWIINSLAEQIKLDKGVCICAPNVYITHQSMKKHYCVQNSTYAVINFTFLQYSNEDDDKVSFDYGVPQKEKHRFSLG
jgi:hypothetical protein